jgi:hypothetical protein
MTNLECLTTEIIEPLRYPEDYSTNDNLQFYNDLLGEITGRLKNTIYKTEDIKYIKEQIIDIIEELNLGREKIRQIRIDEGLCPNCGSKLQTKEFNEDQGEYLGFPSYETIGIDICSNPNCGWTEDKN